MRKTSPRGMSFTNDKVGASLQGPESALVFRHWSKREGQFC